MTARSENSISDSANGGVMLDHDRLRSITQNFRALQSLDTVTAGAFLLVINLAGYYGQGFWAASSVGLLAVFASQKYAPRYYRWRFGWIEERTPPTDRSPESVGFMVLLVAVFSGHLFTHWFSRLAPKGVDLEPIVLLCAIYLYLSLSKPQLMRLRQPYVIPALILFAGVTLFPIWHATDETQLELWKALNGSLIPFFLLVMGLGDHILLLRLLPKRFMADEEGGHHDA